MAVGFGPAGYCIILPRRGHHYPDPTGGLDLIKGTFITTAVFDIDASRATLCTPDEDQDLSDLTQCSTTEPEAACSVLFFLTQPSLVLIPSACQLEIQSRQPA